MLQLWGEGHQNKCRWLILLNTEDAIVCYLASPYKVFISDVVSRDDGNRDGGDLTIAGLWFATALDLAPPAGADDTIEFEDIPLKATQTLNAQLDQADADALDTSTADEGQHEDEVDEGHREGAIDDGHREDEQSQSLREKRKRVSGFVDCSSTI